MDAGIDAAVDADVIDGGPDGSGAEDAGPDDAGSGDADVDANADDAGTAPDSGDDDAGLDGGSTMDAGFDATVPADMALDMRVPACGDGVVDVGEGCDDGEHFSGDGCSGSCQMEACGNGVRDIDERCDRTPGCLCAPGTAPCLPASCDAITRCGNGTLDPGEQCDPTPAMSPAGSWDDDACQSDCYTQQSLIINALSIDRVEGCDYTGDGVADNAFGAAFGGALGLLNGQLENSLVDGQLILLLSMIGLDAPVNDSNVRVGWINGADADADSTNNFSGAADFYANTASINTMSGDPLKSFGSSIVASVLSGGPEDLTLPIAGLFPLELRRGRISGMLTAVASDVTGVSSGLLCGAIPVASFASMPNIFATFGGGTPPPSCDASVITSNLSDALIAGARIGPIRVGPSQPDVDLDGDGLESYVVDDTGPAGCQAVVVSCVDGDGTVISGHDCAGDIRMADAWSAGLPFTAVGANIVGVR